MRKEEEMESSLQSAGLLEQMKIHLSTDAGKEVTKKIGLVYQLNIAPKVPMFFFLTSMLPFAGNRNANPKFCFLLFGACRRLGWMRRSLSSTSSKERSPKVSPFAPSPSISLPPCLVNRDRRIDVFVFVICLC